MNALRAQFPLQSIITGSPAERGDATRLAAMIGGRPIIACSPAIREACALLARCDLYLGNDTGAAHLAAAMNVPSIVISRHPGNGDPNHPNSPQRFAPYGVLSRVLQPESGLDGCASRCTHLEPHCINAITVDHVVSAAREMLDRRQAHAGCFEEIAR